jgi:hypothetical protein
MQEMNEKIPQMKLFAESLERIQKLGGLPDITKTQVFHLLIFKWIVSYLS